MEIWAHTTHDFAYLQATKLYAVNEVMLSLCVRDSIEFVRQQKGQYLAQCSISTKHTDHIIFGATSPFHYENIVLMAALKLFKGVVYTDVR